jgi:hypothetical protein
LVLAARAGLWLGDQPYVAVLIERLGRLGTHGRAVAAAELTLRAGAAALAGEGRAGSRYEAAVASWRSLGLPFHLAICLVERQRFLPAVAGADPDGGGAEAEAILDGLGATGMLRAIRMVTAQAPMRRR